MFFLFRRIRYKLNNSVRYCFVAATFGNIYIMKYISLILFLFSGESDIIVADSIFNLLELSLTIGLSISFTYGTIMITCGLCNELAVIDLSFDDSSTCYKVVFILSITLEELSILFRHQIFC